MIMTPQVKFYESQVGNNNEIGICAEKGTSKYVI